MIGRQRHLLICLFNVILLLSDFTQASLLSFFTGDGDSESISAKLILAPANATISANVSVTLGCKSNIAASQCQWMFYSSDDPTQAKTITPFSPTSPHERRNKASSRAENDCSLTIHKIGPKYDGQWVCSILPVTGAQKFLISQPAFIHVYEGPPAPRLVEVKATLDDETSSETPPPNPANLPYFVIQRSQDQTIKVLWNLRNATSDIEKCSWISPDRVRISTQDSMTDRIWISKEDNLCGLVITDTLDETSYVGKWTVQAETRAPNSLISAHFHLDPPNPSPSESTTILLPVEASESVSRAEVMNPYFFMLLGIIGFLLVVVLALICLICHYCKYPTHKYSSEVPKSPPKLHASIVGVTQRAPIKALKSNPNYESKDMERLSRELPETPRDIQVGEGRSNKRASVIGIDVESPKNQSLENSTLYSHILPKYERQLEHDYLTILRPKTATLAKKSDDGQYELVSGPLPSYENQTDFSTFGFASLRKPTKPKSSIRKVSSMSVSSNQSIGEHSDSGVDSDVVDK